LRKPEKMLESYTAVLGPAMTALGSSALIRW